MARPDWSELLPELLVEIGSSVAIYEDLLSFGGVCSSWKSAARRVASDFTRPSQFPALMLPPETEEELEDSGSGLRDFFLLSPDPDTNNTNAIRTVNLPEASRKRCLSSKGWLFTMDSDDCYPSLLHPYTRQQIRLPKLDTFPDFYNNQNEDCHFIRRLVLTSSDPISDENFLVLVVWGGVRRLGFCKPGDVSWTAINYPEVECEVSTILDITYHNKKVYAVDAKPNLIVWDLYGPNPTKLMIISTWPIDEFGWFRMLYIMPSGLDDDHLWIVSREGPTKEDTKTDYFQVMDIDLKEDFSDWVEIDDFAGKRALFVGFNAAFSIKAERGGCIKPDCIYFTDDITEFYQSDGQVGGRDMGIYDYIEGEIEPYFNNRELHSRYTPPLWIYDESTCS